VGYFNEADLNLLVVQLARRRDGVGPRAAAGWGYMRAWVVGVVLSLEGIGVVVQLGAELSKEVELHRLGYWGGGQILDLRIAPQCSVYPYSHLATLCLSSERN
jgi:hypothetical protein